MSLYYITGRTALTLGAGLKRRNGAQYSHKSQSIHEAANTHTIRNSRQRRTQQPSRLDQVGHIHGHFVNMCIIKLLDIFERTFIIFRDKIYCHTLTTKSSTSANSVTNIKKLLFNK